MSLSALLVSAVLLTTAGFAWFTLSTNPETTGLRFTVGAEESILISIDNGVTFKRSVDLSQRMEVSRLNELHPVSTIDGLNWYVCDYDLKTGNIKEDEFFLLDWCEDPRHGEEGYVHHCVNGRFYLTQEDIDTMGITEEETDISVGVVDSFFAYTDIWVKSEAGSSEVRLSIPFKDEHYEAEESSGSYVLSYDIEEDENGNKTVKILSRGPETCVRVGLMVFTPTKQGDATHVVLGESEDAKDKESLIENFFIYEPNADVRSELDKQSDKYLTDIYVSRLRIKGFESVLDYDATSSFFDSEKNEYNFGKYIPTYPIMATSETLNPNETFTKTTAAAPYVFDPSKLLVQTGAYWDSTAINSAANDVGNGILDLLRIDSPLDIISSLMKNDYVIRGSFIPYTDSLGFYDKSRVGTAITETNTDYAPKDIDKEKTSAASQVLFDLEKDEVRQIRLFFWIEGQDIDCWNDVAGINFLSRLEFATTVK